LKKITYASIPKRAISFTIDDIVVSLLFTIIFYGQITSFADAESMMIFIQGNVWILFLLKIIYHTFFIAFNGATVGKYAVKIKAVNENSNELLSWQMAFLRALVRTIGEMLFYFTFFFAFFSDKNQTFHDKISKCVVVNV